MAEQLEILLSIARMLIHDDYTEQWCDIAFQLGGGYSPHRWDVRSKSAPIVVLDR